MIEDTRTRILWVGGSVPVELTRMMRDWGLELIRDAAPPLALSDPGLRAVLIWHTAKSTGALRARVMRFVEFIDHGVLVAVIAEDERSFSTASDVIRRVVNDIESTTKEAFKGIRVFRLDDAKGTKWAELVRACIQHDPGPIANLALELNGQLKPVELLLFRRAFAGFSKLSLVRQHGGRSGTSTVWRVDAHDQDGHRCEPFIAKVGHRRALREERDTFRDIVRDYLPFPFRPSMKTRGFVEGATMAILCSMFISRAQCFDRYVCTVEYPELVVAAIFDGPLRSWRSHRRPVRQRLGRIYVDKAEAAKTNEEADRRLGRPNRAVLPNMERLESAFLLAKKVDRNIPAPMQLWDMLRALPEISYVECPAHGDLNARNIFIRSTSVDVVLIDFSHAGDWEASSRDPSRLDVNLAFDVGSKDVSS